MNEIVHRSGRFGLHSREDQGECGAATDHRFDVDPTTMGSDDLQHEGEPETRPTACLRIGELGSEARIEDLRDVFRTDAYAVMANGDLNRFRRLSPDVLLSPVI